MSIKMVSPYKVVPTRLIDTKTLHPVTAGQLKVQCVQFSGDFADCKHLNTCRMPPLLFQA